jgi:hypothetical protein
VQIVSLKSGAMPVISRKLTFLSFRYLANPIENKPKTSAAKNGL